MLQQTRTERVLSKYSSFLRKFPTWSALARAPLGSVLREWSGLGYNRRAKYLHEAAKKIVRTYRGRFPRTLEEIAALPGTGAYTANAMLAFAFDRSACCIETNIRTVFIHYFFRKGEGITDDEVRELVRTTLPKKKFREWYYALMDRGAALKSDRPGIHRRSKAYVRQQPFRGSKREVRGAILKLLSSGRSAEVKVLAKTFDRSVSEIHAIVSDLAAERLVIERNGALRLP